MTGGPTSPYSDSGRHSLGAPEPEDDQPEPEQPRELPARRSESVRERSGKSPQTMSTR